MNYNLSVLSRTLERHKKIGPKLLSLPEALYDSLQVRAISLPSSMWRSFKSLGAPSEPNPNMPPAKQA